MDNLSSDLRFGLRLLTRRPAFSVAIVSSLGLGIAANTAIFTIVNSLLVRDVPGVQRPERLVQIGRNVNGDWHDMSFQAVQHLREHAGVLEDAAAFAIVSAAVAAGKEPRAVGGLAVTASYFDLLGVSASSGRTFTREEATFPTVAPVVLISHALWAREFDSQADVVGSQIRVNGYPVEVIGVLPPSFGGHHVGLLFDVFVPLGLPAPGMPGPDTLGDARSSDVDMLGRLRVGVSRTAAITALSAAADRFETERVPGARPGSYAVHVDPWGPLPAMIRGAAAAFLAVLSLLVGLALAMACTNVTSMLLARSSERQREVAIRRALGASGHRIGRQFVTEGLILFACAGAFGVALSMWATGLVASFVPDLPIPGRVGVDLSPDPRVLGFATLVTLGAGWLVSSISAAHIGRFGLATSLREGASTVTRSRARVRAVILAIQVAVTTVLLVAAGLFGNSLRNLRELNPGWNANDVHVLDLDLEQRGATREEGRAFYQALLERVSAFPDVQAAALASKLPLAGCSSFGAVVVPGVEAPPGRRGLDACLNRVSPGYFSTLRLPLLAGREFSREDDERGPRVAVINEVMARRLWPGRDAVGQQFYVGSIDPRNAIAVIGVVTTAKYRSLNEQPRNFYYVPAAQAYDSHMTLHVRTTDASSSSVLAAVRDSVRTLDPDLPQPLARPLSAALAVALLPQRLAAWVAGVMGAFGLLLAVVGIYGATAFAISTRTREFGIRQALGATRGRIVRLSFTEGSTAVGIGIVLGVAVSLIFARAVPTVVPGVNPSDPIALAGVPLGVAGIAALAMLGPVWRVLRRDPMNALRQE
jgi:predicted permease